MTGLALIRQWHTSEYRLGNRSALERVIDQNHVSTHKRSGITNDPNRPDDPEYIVRLIGQIITGSLGAAGRDGVPDRTGHPHFVRNRAVGT